MENQELAQAIHRLEINLLSKLSENTAQLTSHTAKLDQHCDKLDVIFDELKTLKRTVYGVGGNENGLATRTKILEESDINRKRQNYVLFGVSVPTFLNWLWELIRH